MAGISASDVNASIPLGAKPPPFNPLETVGDLNKVQSGLLQNRLLQQEVAGKIARGQAAQGAINAETGQFDPDQFMKNLKAAGPAGAQSAPEAATQAQQNRISQIQQHIAEQNLTQDQIKTSQMENANAARIGQSLLGNGVTSREGISQTLDTVAPTLFKTPEAMQQVAQFKAQLTDDPTQNATILQHFIAAHTDVATALGEYKPTDTGGRILQTRTNPATGAIDVGGAIDKTISPESASELVDVVGADGGHYKVPKSVLLGGGAPAAPQGQGGGTNGRYPSPAGGPRGAVATSALPPGTPEIMAQSAKTYQDDTAAVPQIRKTLTTFDQAMQAIKDAPTGVGSDQLQHLKGLAETYGIPIGTKAKNEAEAYQEFSKWSSSALAQESSRLGLGTDAARQIQSEAQPGTKTIHDAAVKMLPILKGLKAMDLAAPVIFQASGLPPQQYNAWRATWANGVDPLAFGAGSMSKDQRRELIDKMSPDEKTRYAAGLKAAIQAGVFSRGDLAK